MIISKYILDLYIQCYEILSATPGFHEAFTKQQNKMNQKSKNTVKNRWDCVGIFTCACKCVCVCVCLCACVCLCGL